MQQPKEAGLSYAEYWGLSYPPFQNVPDPDLYYPSPLHEEALVRLLYGINGGKGAVLLTGEIGAGKTTVIRRLVKSLTSDNVDVGVLTNPALSLIELLREIHYQLGIPSPPENKLELIRGLNDRLMANYRQGKGTVIIIDEAHLIRDPEILEELRLLLNFQLNDRFLLTLILVGQPELKKTIHDIPPLEQRIAIKYHLGGFDLENSKRYIAFRLKGFGGKTSIFTMEAVNLIHQHSNGIPRNINRLCDLALLFGYLARLGRVDSSIVARVITDGDRFKG